LAPVLFFTFFGVFLSLAVEKEGSPQKTNPKRNNDKLKEEKKIKES